MEQVKEKVVEKVGEEEATDGWTGFVQEVGEWLLGEKAETTNTAAKAIAGLISYGATTEEKLQNVGRGDYDKFTEKLVGFGVPAAICDLLFEQYVARKTSSLPSSSETKNLAVNDVVSQVFSEYLKEPTTLKLELDCFNSFSESFPRQEGVVVPRMVNQKDNPDMLLFELENSTPPDEVTDFLKKSTRAGPSCFYGTSGCGKTRTVLECLSKNYGMYFVSKVSKWNPGSQDLSFLVKEEKLTIGEGNGNYTRFNALLRLLLYSRLRVFERISELMQRKPSAYEWLLIQLHPRYCLGSDVFELLTGMLFAHCSLSELISSFGRYVRTFDPFLCFVDEAQELLHICENKFPSESEVSRGQMIRSMYSAVLKGLSELAELGGEEKGVLFPVFSGTGMSRASFEEAVGSVAAKEPQIRDDKFFTKFRLLAPNDVIAYMAKFANLPQGEDAVAVRHCSEWLKGRPRWTATFMSHWMRGLEYNKKTRERMSSGTSSDLLRQIDGFVEYMTTDSNMSDSFVLTSAFGQYNNLKRVQNEDGLADDVRKAVLQYAISGKPQLISKDRAELIEFGLCAISVDGKEEQTQQVVFGEPSIVEPVVFGEPLIVEAGFNRLSAGWFENLLVTTAENASVSGFTFEKWVLPHIKEKFVDHVKHLKEQGFVIPEQLDQDWTFGLSSYGVVVRKCTTPEETMDWISQSVESEISGSVPPFCFPDESMGPDLLAFLHKRGDWNTRTICLWQMKFREGADQADALRTVVPEFLYMRNRGKSPTLALDGDFDKKRWEKIYKELFGSTELKGQKRMRTQGGFCVLVQYPSKRTKTSNTGVLPLGSCELGDRSIPSSRPTQYTASTPADMLINLDKEAAPAFFGETACKMLDHVKAAHTKKKK